MIYIYYIYLLSYAIFSGYCYYKDVIHLKYKDKINENYIKYKKGLPLVLFNLTVVSYPVFCLALSLYKPRPFSITESIIHIIVVKKINRYLFYFTHRMFHRIRFLQKFHKVHHDFRYPIGMRAAYTHPIDFIFGNMIPLGIMPFILQVNIYVMVLMIVYGVFDTIVNEHSNYNNNDHHLKHHRYYNYNFGEISLDKKFGTYKA